VEIVDLSDVPTQDVVDVYARVFEGPTWFEVDKCSECGKSYPGPAGARQSETYADGEPCWQCGQPLRLISFYRDPEDRLAERVLSNAREQPNFVGVVACADGKLVGFSWGYGLPSTDGPSVLFRRVRERLRESGVDPDALFYAAETGVVPDAQRTGIGEALVRERLDRAVSAGFETAAFRTIDRERLVGLWRKVLGTDAVRELFGDPDPAKEQIWFLGDLAALRDSR